MTITFIKRNDSDKADSRLVADHLKTRHDKWLKRVVLANKEKIEEETLETLEIEEIPNKGARSSLIAWLSPTQVYLAVCLSGNTKTATELKASFAREHAYVIGKRKSATKDSPALQWQELSKNLYSTKEHPFHDQNKIASYFSPDKKFAKFLATLEAETGYVMPHKFEDLDGNPISYPPIYEPYVKKYQEITDGAYAGEDQDYGDDNDWLLDMWGHDERLPFLPNLVPDGEPTQYGFAWVDEPLEKRGKLIKLLKQVKNIVEVYEDPERDIKYGLPSKEEVEQGGYENWDNGGISQPLADILEAYKEFDDLYCSRITIMGFPVHRDWVQWMNSSHKLAQTMRQFYLGSSRPVKLNSWVQNNNDPDKDDFGKWLMTSAGTFIVRQHHWSDIDISYEENPDDPLFSDARLYDPKYESIFDWYLENIWLPQHSLKFFKSCDPQGYPQLVKVLEDLPQSTSLPRQFTRSIQKQVSAASE